MITLKILLQTKTNQKDFVKEYKSIDDFNKWKLHKLTTTCIYIKYSIKKQGEILYNLPIVEYGKVSKRMKL